MNPALALAYGAVAPELPVALVNEDSRRNLSRLASRIPSFWHSFGFECRLGLPGRTVDLGVSVRADAGGSEALSGRTGDPLLERAAAGHACWRHLREFAERWREPESLLRTWAPFLFLEYDSASAARSIPVPSVFVALDAPLRDERELPHLAAAREAAVLLRGRPLDRSLDVKLQACFELMSRTGCVLHLGLMLGRGENGLRLSVVLPEPEVCPYLRRLGGLEAEAVAERLLEALPGWLGRTQLDFDLDPEVRSRVGFGVRPDPVAGEGWESLLHALVALGCCEPEEENALLSWRGECTSGGFTLRRELSHVKLTSARDAPLEAKAYFGVSSRT